ncbi:MAG: YcgN family cysteine cluster protein [Pseudomonadota bacterium]
MTGAADPKLEPGYWRRKALEELSQPEWEALCDGCGKCCLLKLEDEDTGAVHYTALACHLFDDAACRCRDYANRRARVPQCLFLTPETVRAEAHWMPRTCAYRLLAEGRDLFAWHPLISGDPESVHAAGVSMRDRTLSEAAVDPEDAPFYVLATPL